MNASRPSPGEAEEPDLEAARWLVRRDRGLTPAEQDEFLQWLASDPRHAAGLGRHQATWKEFDLLAQWRPEHSAAANPDLLARPAPARPWLRTSLLTLSLAASVALAVHAWWPEPGPKAVPTFSGHVAQGYERRILEDGTVVELNRGAVIAADYSAAERGVWLRQGEAHFQVAKDPARPFVVRADRVNVRALGTAFNVRLAKESVEVLVTEGRVQVHPSQPTNETALDVPLLLAGQRTIVSLLEDVAPPHVEQMTSEEIDRLLAWQPKLLDFNSTPLQEVAAEFNRHNHVQLVIADPALATLPIVASFRSDNVEGFVRLLEVTAHVKAERTGDRLLLRAAR